jgi:uncharacterized protein YwgA
MKSTKNEPAPFSIEDFEKGLMLAGLISPSNIVELNERTALEKYEKELLEEKSKLYFKRAVLAAEIASQLYSEPTFGRIKFQKLVYLCEHAANMKLQERYSKQIAGPFDNKFMHSIEKEFKKQNWFEVQKTFEGNMKRSKYVPLSSADQYKKYYSSYFSECSSNIQYIIDLFRNLRTDFTEIAATLYACFLEIKNRNEQFSEDRLLELFYSWSDKKKRFDQKTVKQTWQWLNEKGLID